MDQLEQKVIEIVSEKLSVPKEEITLESNFIDDLKADLPDDDLRIASLSGLYPGANWHERECWEMFGITFDGHPGLRHLYLPGGFEGHPLRKDFPLLARLVKPWPGIVDVEPMPDDPAAEADPAEADPSADAEGAATGGHGESDAEAGAS